MGQVEIKRGDVFAVNSESRLANAINAVSAFWANDGVSDMNHCGIITNAAGSTFEALWKINSYDLSQYDGRRMVIARPKVLPQVKYGAINRVYADHSGFLYPFWRIPLHLFPPLAKKLSYKGKFLVCSELVARYEFILGIRHGLYTGTRPDTLVDEWRKWRDFDIVFDGVFHNEMINPT